MPHAAADGRRLALFLWDRVPERIGGVRRWLAGSGADIRLLESLDEARQAAASGAPGIALVAIGATPAAQELALEVLRFFRKENYPTFAYEDGTSAWTLGARCRALLAGAQQLLDSAGEDFVTELRRRVFAAIQASAREQSEQRIVQDTFKKQGVVVGSQAMAAVCRRVLRVSSLSDLPVLVAGETGTGKELLAHAIHQLDPKRSRGPFVALNCAALPRALAETELFGHRRGAFTGAEYDRKGLFRAAEEGVLFLDEIAELDIDLQAKLLRVLQENRVLGVGEDREVAVNTRVIAATNQDLSERVRRGEFRADLFHRLHVIAIQIPPLRERAEDVDALVAHFIEKHQRLNPTRTITAGPDFVEALKASGLPGNARQVENAVQQAIAGKEDNTPLSLADLPAELWRDLCAAEVPRTQAAEPPGKRQIPPRSLEVPVPAEIIRLLEDNNWNLPRSLEHCEQLLVEAALHRARGNQSATARLLGITPRSVYNKLRRRPPRG